MGKEGENDGEGNEGYVCRGPPPPEGIRPAQPGAWGCARRGDARPTVTLLLGAKPSRPPGAPPLARGRPEDPGPRPPADQPPPALRPQFPANPAPAQPRPRDAPRPRPAPRQPAPAPASRECGLGSRRLQVSCEARAGRAGRRGARAAGRLAPGEVAGPGQAAGGTRRRGGRRRREARSGGLRRARGLTWRGHGGRDPRLRPGRERALAAARGHRGAGGPSGLLAPCRPVPRGGSERGLPGSDPRRCAGGSCNRRAGPGWAAAPAVTLDPGLRASVSSAARRVEGLGPGGCSQESPPLASPRGFLRGARDRAVSAPSPVLKLRPPVLLPAPGASTPRPPAAPPPGPPVPPTPGPQGWRAAMLQLRFLGGSLQGAAEWAPLRGFPAWKSGPPSPSPPPPGLPLSLCCRPGFVLPRTEVR